MPYLAPFVMRMAGRTLQALANRLALKTKAQHKRHYQGPAKQDDLPQRNVRPQPPKTHSESAIGAPSATERQGLATIAATINAYSATYSIRNRNIL
jgi:hypothetical protein